MCFDGKYTWAYNKILKFKEVCLRTYYIAGHLTSGSRVGQPWSKPVLLNQGEARLQGGASPYAPYNMVESFFNGKVFSSAYLMSERAWNKRQLLQRGVVWKKVKNHGSKLSCFLQSVNKLRKWRLWAKSPGGRVAWRKVETGEKLLFVTHKRPRRPFCDFLRWRMQSVKCAARFNANDISRVKTWLAVAWIFAQKSKRPNLRLATQCSGILGRSATTHVCSARLHIFPRNYTW